MVATEPQSDQAQPVPAGPGLLGQLIRFGVIGGFCALLDLGTYSLLRAAGMDAVPWVDIARAISFVVGTTTAFFLNRRFTFADGRREGNAQVGSFVLLYAVTFFVAVGVNQLMLHVLPESGWKATLAWVVSQATATVINFVMLKWVVFRVRPVKEN
ncbi:GtrA family protein [Amycolatopsis orientalis]|uniref:GtrA family protein n=1 Tax=Amycolatopsis orientalis TaxID=31958 RepID=UPI0005609226|nr:GtrA family protein [Amycolatopsis orientalis]